jgi:cell volume regulation protein A
VWVPGVTLGAVLAFVIRPALVGLCLTGSGLARNERGFVLFAGLKGAVPILLGSFLLSVAIPDTQRLYGIVIVVVIFSVVVQGSLVPAAAQLLAVPMRDIDVQPWALGIRLRDEPPAAHTFVVTAGSPADGATAGELAPRTWISLIIRTGRLISTNSATVLRVGDEVLITDGASEEPPAAIFTEPNPQ